MSSWISVGQHTARVEAQHTAISARHQFDRRQRHIGDAASHNERAFRIRSPIARSGTGPEINRHLIRGRLLPGRHTCESLRLWIGKRIRYEYTAARRRLDPPFGLEFTISSKRRVAMNVEGAGQAAASRQQTSGRQSSPPHIGGYRSGELQKQRFVGTAVDGKVDGPRFHCWYPGNNITGSFRCTTGCAYFATCD
jgi:hypothetical protein